MEGSVAGVRILPAVVQFHDAEPGVLHQMNLKVQNLSKFSKSVRFHAPDSEFFSVKVKNPEKPIAPGLDVTALVEYYTEHAEDKQDRAILLVDNDIIEIPLIAFTPSPQLEIRGPVNFGSTVADGKVLTGYFSIDNYGSKAGEFKIKYTGKQPITLSPTSGTVEAETSQKIKVEFISKTCGKLQELVNVKLEGQEEGHVEILADVVERNILLLNLQNKTQVQHIQFGPTYYGTDQLQSFLLCNNGPDKINFVVLLDEDSEGQEVGLDLTKNATALMISQPRFQSDDGDDAEDLTSLITVSPNQGSLAPGESVELYFKFSPRFQRSSLGWKSIEELAPRKDYALFINIEAVGVINQNIEGSFKHGCKLEIAVSGTAIPVDISVDPGTKFLFGDCSVGEHVDALCSIKNNSSLLPITFTTKPLAHFHPKPCKALLKTSRSADIMISFKPKQMGTFASKLDLNFLGTILDSDPIPNAKTPVVYRQVVIHTLSLQLHGICNNPGASVLKSAVRSRHISSSPCLNSPRTGGVKHMNNDCEIAQPNDRATSIRPAERNSKIRTQFTDIQRYSYVDPDFSLTDEEARRKQQHKQLYLNYIRDSRTYRELKNNKREMNKWENNKDLGMKPAHGLPPPKLSVKEVSFTDKGEREKQDHFDGLLSTKTLATPENVLEGLNAIPVTDIEKLDCNKTLTPQQIKKIEIDSALIDFGEVCQRSVKTKYLTVGNNLNQHIHIVVKIDCRELRQSSPLSQVIPPYSTAKIYLLFESNSKGSFERSIEYKINERHQFHVVAKAQVVPVALELSCDEVILKPTPSMAAESGFRSVVTISNKRNAAADFSWRIVNGKNETSFSIRPSKGTVEPFSSLDCEVVFYPSFCSSRTTQFSLNVEGGNQPKLLCQAQFGPAQCCFVERRFVFGFVPLHLTTVRKCHLKNTGSNHAYFQVVNTSPLAGMVISPKNGVVPVGGTTEIKVEFTPDLVHKFDSEIEVNILGWKTISLRLGGTVEQPCVDVDVGVLQFNGVYCDATTKVPFKLCNKARSKANVVFDLSRYRDFSLDFHHDKKDKCEENEEGLFNASLQPLETLDCVLIFKPSEVASYNFILPVTINDTLAPSPTPSSIPPSPAPSNTNWTLPELDTPPPILPSIPTPSRRVLATALRPPLQISHSHLKFTLPAGYFDLGVQSDAGRVQSCILVNNSNKPCKWCVDFTSCSSLFDDDIFTFIRRSGSPYPCERKSSLEMPNGVLQCGETFQLGVMFSPTKPGLYRASVPVILNDDHHNAYRVLELEGELLSADIKFEPKTLDFKVVPLAIENSVEFEIITKGYRKSCEITVELPEVEMNDGNRMCLLSSTFPKGTKITPCYSDDPGRDICRIPCKLTFRSPKPVSFATEIMFIVDNEKFYLPVTATADNCLLTNYPFLALHRHDYHIVCEQKPEMVANGDDNTSISTEAFLLPCITPNRPLTHGSTSATSTTFGISTSSYEDSTDPSSSLRDTPSPVEGIAHNGITRHEELQFVTELGSRDLIGGHTPEELIFFKEVLKALQRWISLQAWSSGPYPIKIPKYFQDSFETMEDFTVSGQGGWNGSVHKDARTIFQLVAHLCGRHIPGIPVNFSFPSDRRDRVRKIHWMYSALLVFLRAQGALLAHVNAEDLMSFNDFTEWEKIEDEVGSRDHDVKSRDEQNDKVRYERLSCRAWSDLLLQLLKVFVLGRVTPQWFKKMSYPPDDSGPPFVNPDPLSSNIYSVGERILLAWFNHHYKEQKQKTWAINKSLPSARWIVNFDLDFMDGLVLAAVLAAHCPFLVNSHLRNMFLHPVTAEQCLHNALQVVEAFKVIQLDYDVVATDITEANPVSILLLCLHLYQHLPHYIPRTTVDFTGNLHSTITKHVQLQNPSSSKPLFYRAIVLGEDASDFTVPMGNIIQVSPKGQIQLPVEFKSRFLRPCNATLVLVGKRAGSACGSTLVFNLRTSVDNITPRATIKCESPLYEINKVDLDISNPFPHKGKFRVVLVEARGQLANNKNKEKKMKTKTIKHVESKTDHGQSRKKSSKKEVVIPVTPEKKTDPQLLPENLTLTRAFWCSDDNIELEANGKAKIEINFVPFQLGHRQCSVLLINEDIGEFLYLIETETVLPLPCRVPYVPSAHSVRVSSSLAAHHGRGIYGGDDRVLYWKCDSGETFTENIMITRTNLAKENALAIIGQKNMSKKELQRREITNTLNITSITSAMNLLGLAPDYYPNMIDEHSFKTTSGCIAFKVESSSKYFSVPPTLKIPLEAPSTHDNGVALPVQFTARDPGHYPCQISLKSVNDMRIYQIECTVSPGGLDTQLEFTTPLHQSVTQEIPVVNQTKQDWQLIASIEGEGFYGPPVLIAKACLTSYYPLMFRPTSEDSVKGKLVLTNALDGSEQMYRLKGVGDAPVAIEHLVIECDARKKTIHNVQLPMSTNKRRDFKVVSDLGIVTGQPYFSCIPSITTNYQLTVFPWKRGVFNGVLSFIESSLPGAKSASRVSRTNDSDTSDEEQDTPSLRSSSPIYTRSEPASNDPVKPFRFWYSLEIRASPPPPEKVLDVRCAVLSAVGVEITVFNPSEEEVVMNIIVEGEGVYGDPVLVLGPKQQTLYQAKYAPTMIGMQEGSIIFQHEIVGEFWYKLNLLAEQPEPKQLPNIDSELGSHSHQMIQLENPTGQTLVLTPYSSNQRNFTLELDTSKQLSLVPHGIIQVPLRFTPSQIGLAKHKAKIVFRSEQLGDWTFIASGTGLNPKPAKPIYVHGQLSEHSSVIVPFRNPTEHNVIVDVSLKEKSINSGCVFLSGVSGENSNELAFCLLLKRNDGIILRPQEIIDIPVTFTPHSMKSYEATVTVSIQRYDIAPETSYSDILPTTMINNLSWIFPLKGIPVSHVMSTSRAITIECQARDRTEQIVELTLSGVVSSGRMGSLYTTENTRPISLVREDSINDIQMGIDNVPFSESFSYEFLYGDDDCQNALERSLGIQLEKKYRNKTSGVVTLIYRLIFSPYKPFNHIVHLVISAGSGGVWKYPIRFLATEADVDDTITVEAVGLNKEAVVGFRLTSQSRQSVPFIASLTADSDKEFALYCSSKLLLPQDSEGTLIKVTYKPTLYGKIHKAKIIVQTSDMQWTYDVKGVTPEYTPPSGQSVITTKQTTYVKQKKKNYIRDNLRLQATGVSSPIKGTPIVQRSRRNLKV